MDRASTPPDILAPENVIAQDDDNDYVESGYVVCVKDGRAAIGKYSHCSCYGTWDVTNGVWTGTIQQLIDMARRKSDPDIPEREASPTDYDHGHLMSVYEQVLKWHAEWAGKAGG